jgi:hypothetical protein
MARNMRSKIPAGKQSRSGIPNRLQHWMPGRHFFLFKASYWKGKSARLCHEPSFVWSKELFMNPVPPSLITSDRNILKASLSTLSCTTMTCLWNAKSYPAKAMHNRPSVWSTTVFVCLPIWSNLTDFHETSCKHVEPDSSASILTIDCGMDDRDKKFLSSLPRPLIREVPGAHPWGQADGAWNWPLTSILCQGLEWLELYLHFTTFFHGVMLNKHQGQLYLLV